MVETDTRCLFIHFSPYWLFTVYQTLKQMATIATPVLSNTLLEMQLKPREEKKKKEFLTRGFKPSPVPYVGKSRVELRQGKQQGKNMGETYEVEPTSECCYDC